MIANGDIRTAKVKGLDWKGKTSWNKVYTCRVRGGCRKKKLVLMNQSSCSKCFKFMVTFFKFIPVRFLFRNRVNILFNVAFSRFCYSLLKWGPIKRRIQHLVTKCMLGCMQGCAHKVTIAHCRLNLHSKTQPNHSWWEQTTHCFPFPIFNCSAHSSGGVN